MGAGAICSRNPDRVSIGNSSSASVLVPPDSIPSPNDIVLEETDDYGGGTVVYYFYGNFLLYFVGT